MDAAPERGLSVIFEAGGVALHDVETDAPYVTLTSCGEHRRLDAVFIAGCDGFHGASRKAVPASHLREFEREYPFAG